MKKLGWLLLLLIVIAATIALAPLVPLGTLRPKAQARLSNLFNRPVEIGSMHLSLWGGPYLVMKRVTIRMAPEFGSGNLLEADQVSANLAAMPLLQGDVVIEGLKIESPQIRLVKNEAGVWNWTVDSQPVAIQTPTPLVMAGAFVNFPAATTARALERIEAHQASIRLVDRTSPESPETLYRNVNLTASIVPASGNSRVSGLLNAQSGEDGSEPLTLNAPFELTLDHSKAAVAFSGRIGPVEIETANFAAHQLVSPINLQNRQLVFDPIDMNLYDGTMHGRIAVDLSNNSFTSNGTVDHLNLDNALTGKLQIPGEIKGHISAEFNLQGDAGQLEQVFQSWQGDGHILSGQLLLPGFNVSEQVAHALSINRIGQMDAGTEMTGITGKFRLENELLTAEGLAVEGFDGLGQARIERGWLNFGNPPKLNFTATAILSPEATEQVKASGLLLGAITTWFEKEKRLTIPVSVTGSVRNPSVQVDVRRMF